MRALALVSLLGSGCYDMHTPPGGGPTVLVDAGTRPDASVGLEAGSREDAAAALPDAALACPLERPLASCFESFAIPAGQPTSLPFEMAGCGCCIQTACEVSVDEAARVVHLTTTACPDACRCDACNVPRGSCELPPLHTLGAWTVEANGVPGFSIGVVEVSDPTFAPPPPGCASYAEPDTCGGAPPDFTAGPERGAVCLARDAIGSRLVLSMTRSCTTCGRLDSSCDVILEPRLTDDLPPGGELRLTVRDYATACDIDCPGACIPHVRECVLPPLTNGDYYRVWVDGELVSSFVGGEPLAPCPTR
ncbi:MAG: hypothetical protein U0353_32410 [Sandaracinus sp.]